MKWFRAFLAFCFLAVIVSLCFFFSPDAISQSIRSYASDRLEKHLFGIVDRYKSGNATSFDRMEVSVAMWFGGALFSFSYPEAAAILSHYLNGNTDELKLDADYVKNSPVVRDAIKKRKAKSVRFYQHQDYRLSLAVNGFDLKAQSKGNRTYYKLSQKIEFSHPKSDEDIYTNIVIGKFSFKFPDGLVWLGDGCCKPFIVSFEWVE